MRREPHVRFCERAGVQFLRATHLVILCRKGRAEEALQRLRDVMGRLKLTVNEEKRIERTRWRGNGVNG
jgi:hypothetical protein